MGRYTPVEKTKQQIQKEERLGETIVNNQGLKMTIIDYIDSTHITVKFEDGLIKENMSYRCFKRGGINNENFKRARTPKDYDKRIGESRKNNDGELMTIIEYKNCDDILVEFNDRFNTQINSTYDCFSTGTIRNPNRVGKYGQVIGKECSTSGKEFRTWEQIVERVFNPRKWEDRENYKNVGIYKDWLYYPNFYKWIKEQENYNRWNEGERWAIDKDILSDPNNKIYSPDTCCLVPNYVNAIFANRKINDMPLGVWKPTNFKKETYAIEIKENGRKKNYYFSDKEEAGEAYKEYRKKHIKEVADYALSIGDITKKCYNGMLNYVDPRWK